MGGEDMTKKAIAAGFLALAMLLSAGAEANAAACAAGPYRAGCVGPRGAVGVHRPYGYGYHGAAVVRPYGAAVVRPAYGVRCFYRAGVRVCR
jgi:hypothetical protein